MEILNIRHAWPEGAGFRIQRARGTPDYVFLHFWNPMRLNLAGESIVTLPGACILYDIGTPQYFSAESAIVHDWMHLAGGAGAEAASFGIACNQVYYPRNSPAITAIMRELEKEFFSKGKYSQAFCLCKLSELFIILARGCEFTAEHPILAATRDSILALRVEMLEEPGKNWQVGDMAAKVNISPSRFHAFYKQMFGISPVNDVILARIERAKALLSKTDMPVAEIAEALGYASVFHFIRQFRGKTGSPPGQYRKNR